MTETQTSRYRVLVIDDDPYIGRLILLNLQKANIDCRVSADGIAGLIDFQEFNPHLVITDILMPGMDGRGVCATIRDISMVPILVMTSADTSEAELAVFKAGADDYIPKPFDLRLMVLRVTAHLRRVYQYDARLYGAKTTQEPAEQPADQTAPAGYMSCRSCGHTDQATNFRRQSPTGERILRCPQCNEHEHFVAA